MVQNSPPFDTATTDLVERWYQWVSTLDNKTNPFSPSDAGKSWQINQPDDIIWLAGITATTEPAYKPVEAPNEKALIERSLGATVYNDGKGNPVQRQKLLDIIPRQISLEEGDSRNLYLPVDTELAMETKYPKIKGLSLLARHIIDRENNTQGNPPAQVVLNNEQKLEPSEIKSFAVTGSINSLKFEKDNVFMLPEGEGEAAFYDYSVIVKNEVLNVGRNELVFGVKGKFFDYTVTYIINKPSSMEK